MLTIILDLIEFAEIQVGGSFREYELNSLVEFTDVTASLNMTNTVLTRGNEKKFMTTV
jgi:hypothetical protein